MHLEWKRARFTTEQDALIVERKIVSMSRDVRVQHRFSVEGSHCHLVETAERSGGRWIESDRDLYDSTIAEILKEDSIDHVYDEDGDLLGFQEIVPIEERE